MTNLSATQIRALAQIRFAGLVVYSDGDEAVDFAVLDLMPAASIRVNRLTVKRLMKEGLIEQDPDSEYEVDWRITSLGHKVLREHPQALSEAGREVNAIQAFLTLDRILRQLEKEDGGDPQAGDRRT